ncbi:MAG: SAM-dependent methyltransferase, partial [Anaerolineae bacterium]|nr:SAM-dependent methyltransferase [Anaerolineae bacterium]
TLGLTAVRLMDIKDNVITVKGLDAINDTPILDIKPYAPVYDGVQDPLVPAWFIQLMQGNA